ncbi:N-acetyltransferase [Thalassospira sp. HJ]|uniref:GNAT family N-acetyltransferase n=1 Tax=Thalassospira sp. HJ TaxID=1616823 RepID=UPI0013793016|nr:GNAT family N-acetyltransferase [Thalassospira sp. HJ]
MSEAGKEDLNQVLFGNNRLFVSCKLHENDFQSIDAIESMGFVEINQQITFSWKPDKLTPVKPVNDLEFRYSSSKELRSSLVGFADLFVTDRFRTDSRLPSDWSVRVKTNWILSPDENRQILLAQIGKDIAGFIVLRKYVSRTIIDLIVVDPSYRGQKIGRQLLLHLQKSIKKNQVIIVGTQHDNHVARKLYASAGFRNVDTKKVYHFYRERVL